MSMEYVTNMSDTIMNYIKVDALVVGRKYECDARNFTYGTWNGEAFEYEREKFGHKFPDTELHYDTHPHYGTVKPLRLIEHE